MEPARTIQKKQENQRLKSGKQKQNGGVFRQPPAFALSATDLKQSPIQAKAVPVPTAPSVSPKLMKLKKALGEFNADENGVLKMLSGLSDLEKQTVLKDQSYLNLMGKIFTPAEKAKAMRILGEEPQKATDWIRNSNSMWSTLRWDDLASFLKAGTSLVNKKTPRLKSLWSLLQRFNLDENKVLSLLKSLTAEERSIVLKFEKVFLDPMTAAFSPLERVKAMKYLCETDYRKAVRWILKGIPNVFERGWPYSGISVGIDWKYEMSYFLRNGRVEELEKAQQDKWWTILYEFRVSKPEFDAKELKQERQTSLDSKKNTLEGTTSGFYNLRAWPGLGKNSLLGKLDGAQANQVKVLEKKIGLGHVWFKIKFKNPVQYQQLLSKNALANKSFQSTIQAKEAWLTGKALNLTVSYAQFMKQLKAWEKLHPKLSLKDRITKLRQMCHGEKLEFDHVLARKQGDYYQNQRPELDGMHQFMKRAQAVRLPNGQVVDMYHFLVGLDVLEPGNPRVANKHVRWLLEMGENHAAATWSGDIGAGVAEMVLNVSNTTNKYEKDFRAKAAAAQKAKKKYDLTDTRRKYYFKSRAPEADLLADIDAWGAARWVGYCGMDSIEKLVEMYYGEVNDKKGTTLKQNRKIALVNFFKNYKVNSLSNLDLHPSAKHLETQIYKFAKLWARQKRGLKVYLTDEIVKGLKSESKNMTVMFLNWLKDLAKKVGVRDADLR